MNKEEAKAQYDNLLSKTDELIAKHGWEEYDKMMMDAAVAAGIMTPDGQRTNSMFRNVSSDDAIGSMGKIKSNAPPMIDTFASIYGAPVSSGEEGFPGLKMGNKTQTYTDPVTDSSFVKDSSHDPYSFGPETKRNSYLNSKGKPDDEMIIASATSHSFRFPKTEKLERTILDDIEEDDSGFKAIVKGIAIAAVVVVGTVAVSFAAKKAYDYFKEKKSSKLEEEVIAEDEECEETLAEETTKETEEKERFIKYKKDDGTVGYFDSDIVIDDSGIDIAKLMQEEEERRKK